MERILSKDPLPVELYEGSEIPEKHKLVEPTNTNHLFAANPLPHLNKVSLIAKDIWGNEYSAEMSIKKYIN